MAVREMPGRRFVMVSADEDTRAGAAATARSRSGARAGYAAAAWALVFAAMSFYWAAGGTIGGNTQAPGIRELGEAREPWFVAVLWITAILKALIGFLALALVQPWRRPLPCWLLRTAAWVAGVGMALYGGLNLAVGAVVAGLRVVGVINPPADTAAFWWHLLLWDPWWLLGGILFVAAAWSAGRRA